MFKPLLSLNSLCTILLWVHIRVLCTKYSNLFPSYSTGKLSDQADEKTVSIIVVNY